MADPLSEKGEGTAHPDAAPPSPSRSSSDSPVQPKYEEIRPSAQKDTNTDGGQGKDAQRPSMDRLRSYATATSVTSAPSAHFPEPKPWYKQPNPMRWGKIPPIPEERKVCGEHNAGFFSKLIFHWMGPLMNVSAAPRFASATNGQRHGHANTEHRRATGASSSSATFPTSTRNALLAP